MKNKIKYSAEDTLPVSIDPGEVSVRISIVMEGDLLDALKGRAAGEKRPYQTIMKEILREALADGSRASTSLDALEKRLDAIERRVFPPKGIGAEKNLKANRRSLGSKKSKKAG